MDVIESFDIMEHVPAELIMPPGLYFGLPEAEYHSKFALSGSGIKQLHVSPYDFWVRSSLNPNLADVQEDEPETAEMTLGSAYHKRILEGKEEFYRCYAPKPDPKAYPEALFTASALKDYIRKHNETVDKADRVKLGGDKEDLIERVLDINPTAQIWDVIEEIYYKEHKGKEFLTAKELRQIEIMAAMVEMKPDLRNTFKDGYPEVSLFWVCQHTGVPCKLRMDYMKAKQIVELKGFQNQKRLPIERAIYMAFAGQRYARSAAWYMEGASYIPALIKAGRVFGDVDKEFIKAISQPHRTEFKYVFIQKGVAPVARGKTFSPDLSVFQIAAAKNDSAKQTFRLCLETYERGVPWVDQEPTTPFNDEEMPVYAAD